MHRLFLYIVLLLSILSCSGDGGGPVDTQEKKLKEYRDSATIKMAELLLQHYNAMPALKTNYKNSERADYFLDQAENTGLVDQVQLSIRGSFELINAGRNEEALSVLTKIFEKVKTLQFAEKNQIVFNILGLRAIAYFRIAELENCRTNHNSASCILPFQESSFHKLRNGSESAIKDILEILKLKRDPNFVYLLNVAYMSLGEYPDQVPEEYLIPLTIEEEQVEINQFTNVASGLGIDDNKLSGGGLIEDFDNDGDLDIITSSWNLRDDLAYYINNGNGSFVESHMKAGLKGITGGLNMIQGDYNNDGYVDVLVLRGAWLPIGKNPNSLLRNNGDGTFSDVTESCGLLSLHPTQTATWSDFNNDGYLDLFIGNESYDGFDPNPCELYLNSPEHVFTNVADKVNANVVGYIKGVASSDIDNDGDQDLFLSNLDEKNILLRNDKSDSKLGFEFVNISESAGIENPLQSFPTWFFDFDNDGWEDLFVASYPISYYSNLPAEYLKELLGNVQESESPKLYKNNGDNTFKDVTIKMGLDKTCFTMGSNFGDLNNDGFLDIYLGTGEPDLKAVIPNRAFLNRSGRKFSEVTSQTGLGHIQKGHSISFADLDNDGDQDIYAVMGGAFEGDAFYNAMFENPGHGNSFLKLSLIGVRSNRTGIGAHVRVGLTNGKTIHRRVSSGSSFGGNLTSRIEIGIPDASSIEAVDIIWPSGAEQSFKNIVKGKWYALKEDIAKAEEQPLTVQKFNLSQDHTHHH